MDLKGYIEGGETARTGSVLRMRPFVEKFPRLSHDASQTRFGLHFFTFPAREICFAPSGRPLKTRTLYQIAVLPIKRGIFEFSIRPFLVPSNSRKWV